MHNMTPGHFLPSPALASPVGNNISAQQQQQLHQQQQHQAQPMNPSLAANAPCSTLYVANWGMGVSEHELKEIFAR